MNSLASLNRENINGYSDCISLFTKTKTWHVSGQTKQPTSRLTITVCPVNDFHTFVFKGMDGRTVRLGEMTKCVRRSTSIQCLHHFIQVPTQVSRRCPVQPSWIFHTSPARCIITEKLLPSSLSPTARYIGRQDMAVGCYDHAIHQHVSHARQPRCLCQKVYSTPCERKKSRSGKRRKKRRRMKEEGTKKTLKRRDGNDGKEKICDQMNLEEKEKVLSDVYNNV